MASANILAQYLLANATLDIPLPSNTVVDALVFAHTGGSNADVSVYLIPQLRPPAGKSTSLLHFVTVTAGTTSVFNIEGVSISFVNHLLQVETDSNGAGNIMLTVLGR